MSQSLARQAIDAVETLDREVAEAAAPIRDTRAIKAIGFVSELGDQPPMRVICAGVIGAGLLRRDRKLARAGVRMLLSHSLATWAKILIKHQVDRTRPKFLEEEGEVGLKRGHSRDKEQSSFPSGHTAGAVSAAGTFAKDYPEHALYAWGVSGAIAVAQVPRCMHYPSDIAAGAAIGLASAALVNRLVPATKGG